MQFKNSKAKQQWEKWVHKHTKHEDIILREYILRWTEQLERAMDEGHSLEATAKEISEWPNVRGIYIDTQNVSYYRIRAVLILVRFVPYGRELKYIFLPPLHFYPPSL